MKKLFIDFLKRGLTTSVGGPVVMAVVYLFLDYFGVANTVSVSKIATEILTVSLMAFIASGITVIYKYEKLPIFTAALIHGIALYADYILFYLLKGWLKSQIIPILVFTGIFIAGYMVIWLIIYLVTKSSTASLNKKLKL